MRPALTAATLAVCIGAAGAMPFGAMPMKHTVTDARGAILVARAMMLAKDSDSPATPEQRRHWLEHWSDQAWLEHCNAMLKGGVWVVTNKGPHRPRTGYFSGAAAIYIGADDGRFLGELFVD